jgi:hypothetical protein
MSVEDAPDGLFEIFDAFHDKFYFPARGIVGQWIFIALLKEKISKDDIIQEIEKCPVEFTELEKLLSTLTDEQRPFY